MAAKKKVVKKAATKKAALKPKVVIKTVLVKPEPLPKARSVAAPRNSGSKSYTYSEFLENIRAFCGLKKRSDAKAMCEDISVFIKEALKKGYKLPLMGLGKLYVRETKPRMGRNPATGETISIPAKKRVRFTPTKQLKEDVLRK